MIPVLEDSALPHQIRLGIIRWHGSQVIRVSCTCRAVPREGRGGYETIASRYLFPAGEALAAWRAWHAERGVTV